MSNQLQYNITVPTFLIKNEDYIIKKFKMVDLFLSKNFLYYDISYWHFKIQYGKFFSVENFLVVDVLIVKKDMKRKQFSCYIYVDVWGHKMMPIIHFVCSICGQIFDHYGLSCAHAVIRHRTMGNCCYRRYTCPQCRHTCNSVVDWFIHIADYHHVQTNS